MKNVKIIIGAFILVSLLGINAFAQKQNHNEKKIERLETKIADLKQKEADKKNKKALKQSKESDRLGKGLKEAKKQQEAQQPVSFWSDGEEHDAPKLVKITKDAQEVKFLLPIDFQLAQIEDTEWEDQNMKFTVRHSGNYLYVTVDKTNSGIEEDVYVGGISTPVTTFFSEIEESEPFSYGFLDKLYGKKDIDLELMSLVGNGYCYYPIGKWDKTDSQTIDLRLDIQEGKLGVTYFVKKGEIKEIQIPLNSDYTIIEEVLPPIIGSPIGRSFFNITTPKYSEDKKYDTISVFVYNLHPTIDKIPVTIVRKGEQIIIIYTIDNTRITAPIMALQ